MMDAMQRERKGYFFLAGVIVFSGLVNGYVNYLIAASPGWYWSFELLYWIVLPLVIFTFAMRVCGLSPTAIGIGSRIFGVRSLPLVFIASLAFAPLSLWWYREVYLYFRAHFPGEPFFAYQMVLPQEQSLRQLVSVYFALTAGVVEELYYRGLFFRLAQLLPATVPVYAIASPILFALVHWEGGVAGMLAAYAYGLLMVAAFLIMRNLWPLVVGHVYTDYVWFSA